MNHQRATTQQPSTALRALFGIWREESVPGSGQDYVAPATRPGGRSLYINVETGKAGQIANHAGNPNAPTPNNSTTIFGSDAAAAIVHHRRRSVRRLPYSPSRLICQQQTNHQSTRKITLWIFKFEARWANASRPTKHQNITDNEQITR